MTHITDSRIATLRAEAAEHGDSLQEAICLRALGAEPSEAEPGMDLAELTMTVTEARAECARVIAAAQAQDDSADLSYEVFDGDPSSCGPCGWEAESRCDIDASDYDDAHELAAHVLEWALREVQPGDYESGDALWVVVYGPQGTVTLSGEIDFGDVDD